MTSQVTPLSPTFDWRSEFFKADMLPTTASQHEKAARGRLFEKILAGMFEEADLHPRLGFRPRGEEIDGSLWMHGRTILLEAKWTVSAHPASSLYQFRGKVEGKLTGTIGLFVSMGGFSPDAVDALIAGKGVSLILMDGDDIKMIAKREISIVEALERKLRAAGEAGTPFYPLSSANARVTHGKTHKTLILVEGRFDARVLTILNRVYGGSESVTILPSGGPHNMFPLLSSLVQVAEVDQVFLIMDNDLRTQGNLERQLNEAQATIGTTKPITPVYLDPDLEVALGLAPQESAWTERKHLHRMGDLELEAHMLTVDIEERARNRPDVAQVFHAFGITEI